MGPRPRLRPPVRPSAPPIAVTQRSGRPHEKPSAKAPPTFSPVSLPSQPEPWATLTGPGCREPLETGEVRENPELPVFARWTHLCVEAIFLRGRKDVKVGAAAEALRGRRGFSGQPGTTQAWGSLLPTGGPPPADSLWERTQVSRGRG